MEYNELVELWKKQREQYQLWEVRLTFGSQKLRDQMEAALNLSVKKWLNYDTKEEHRYVELVDFYRKPKAERNPPKADSITPKGELVFGMSVTFDHGPNSYPKSNMYIPIAMRFNQNKIEYARFNTENDCAEQEWTTDGEEFCSKMIKQYADDFNHDPHAGFERKTQIGFM